MIKPKVLLFVRYYLPGYKSGGPVRSIANMVEQLSDDVQFFIVTSDRDALDDFPYTDININQWNSVGKAKTYYLAPGFLKYVKIVDLINSTEHNLLYLNSFFDPTFSLSPLLAYKKEKPTGQPVILAPRGEFSTGAVKLKNWKKQPYLKLSKTLGLYNNIIWHASSEQEKADIIRVFGSAAEKIVIAPNLPPLIDSVLTSQAETNREATIRLVFMSRIAPMKNLDYAIRIVASTKVPIEFHIYGPIWDDAYWLKCQKMIKQLPGNVKVTYKGVVEQDRVRDVFSQYDLFLFPTRGENFGHVILESLSVGTPVLISDQTPWVTDGKGGCTVKSLKDIFGFTSVIEKIAFSSSQEMESMREAAYDVAKAYINNTEMRKHTLSLFEEHLSL